LTAPTESSLRTEFEKLFKAHYAALVTFAAGMVESADAAEDLVQEVFIAVWRRRAEMPPDKVARAYLYKAVRHRALNALRHDRIARESADTMEHSFVVASAEDDLIHDEAESAVRAAISRLPERSRLMFTLSRDEGLTYAEIAKVTGVSVKTVETQMGRALRALRESLADFQR
jgi:RNA polymerase sigma-70 factor (ECF subfamily)